MPPATATAQRGFNLIEMAIALMLLALTLGGGLMSLEKQQEVARVRETQRLLGEARDALFGFAIAQGRLPCPASATSNGQESPPGGGTCTHPHDGFLPAVTLGLSNPDSGGYAPDGWTTPANRLRYSLSTANGGAFSTPNGMRTVGIANLNPDLLICTSATGMTASSCAPGNTLSNSAVAVILSFGRNAANAPGGLAGDEAANQDGDRRFVAAAARDAGATDGEFDDQLIWIAPGTLYNRLLLAGQIP